MITNYAEGKPEENPRKTQQPGGFSSLLHSGAGAGCRARRIMQTQCKYRVQSAECRGAQSEQLTSVNRPVSINLTSKCAIATLSASGEAQTPRRKEVGTQEPEIPTIATLEQAT